MGSKMTLASCETSVILSGVMGSSLPRYVANPTVASSAGTKLRARKKMYGVACTSAGAPVGSTKSSARPGAQSSRNVPTSPTTVPSATACATSSSNPSLSPAAAALAIKGATTVGMKLMTQKELEKTWFAA